MYCDLNDHGGSGWTPAMLGANLYAWLDAADATSVSLTSAEVSQWNDKSGNGRNLVTPGSTYRPGYTSNVSVNFSGTKKLIATSWPTQFDVFIVNTSLATNSTFRTIIRNSDNYHHLLFSAGGDSFGMYNGSFSSAGIWATSTKKLVYGSMNNAGGWTIALDGNIPGSTLSTFSAGVRAITQVGNVTDDINPQPCGNVHEIVLTSNLSSTDRQKTEGYLAWKWGLQSNLPSGHPYKSSFKL